MSPALPHTIHSFDRSCSCQPEVLKVMRSIIGGMILRFESWRFGKLGMEKSPSQQTQENHEADGDENHDAEGDGKPRKRMVQARVLWHPGAGLCRVLGER